jgi:hypothetical protein
MGFTGVFESSQGVLRKLWESSKELRGFTGSLVILGERLVLLAKVCILGGSLGMVLRSPSWKPAGYKVRG